MNTVCGTQFRDEVGFFRFMTLLGLYVASAPACVLYLLSRAQRAA